MGGGNVDFHPSGTRRDYRPVIWSASLAAAVALAVGITVWVYVTGKVTGWVFQLANGAIFVCVLWAVSCVAVLRSLRD
jgi:hypothetical protein